MRQDPSRTDGRTDGSTGFSLFSCRRISGGSGEERRTRAVRTGSCSRRGLSSPAPATCPVACPVRVRPSDRRRDYLATTFAATGLDEWKLPSRADPAYRAISPIDRTGQGVEGVDSEPIDRIINSVHKLAWLGGPSATFLRLVFCFRLRHPSCSDEIQAGGEKIGTG